MDLQAETVKEEDGSKNKKQENNEDEDDEENLESLLTTFGDGGGDDDDEYDGDDLNFETHFVNEEEQEANAAKERRLARKRRLLLEDSNNPASNKTTVTVTVTATATNTTEVKIKEEEPPPPQVKKDDNGDGGDDENNGEIPSDNANANANDDSDDESDMFGSPSPSSSLTEDHINSTKKMKKSKGENNNNANNNNNNNNNKRQDGFDDSEGYYKASIGETMDLEVIGYNNNNNNNSDSDKDDNNILRLRVLGVIGKGVFSSVLKCSTTSTTQTQTQASTTTTSNEEEGMTTNDGIPTSIIVGDNSNSSTNTSSNDLPQEVAVKCIRSNETMTKAAINEMKFLIRLTRDKNCATNGIIPLLLPSLNSNSNPNSNTNSITNSNALPPSIDFRGHTILIFPYLPYNLRDVLQKFGKGIGLSLSAVSNYYKQLLNAALHLQKHCIIHCDIKPDNILVSGDFKRLLIADFGSAIEATVGGSVTSASKDDDGDDKGGGVSINEIITPYLVSRFYRSPEIILGLSNQITYGIDLWSLAVTAGELFLGKVLFNGSNNNDMLYVIMTNLGPFSSRIIRSHLLQTKKHPELIPAHFSQVQSNYVFRKETVDTVLDQAVHKEISLGSNDTNSEFNKPSLQSRLLKARSPKDKRIHVMKFADLLSKCLVLDPSKRISVKSALKHDFFHTSSSS